MKKKYIQPRCETFAMGTESGILAGSPNYVDPGTGEKQPIEEDKGDSGWAASKGNNGSSLWDDDNDY